ncbi:hypothetical protein [Lentzea sp. NPDC051838]|uniref:hypothetical protein n=1 Tax=Lentzea sp. NPDC051838 TaxID=3154849 RepID=UPI00342F662D
MSSLGGVVIAGAFGVDASELRKRGRTNPLDDVTTAGAFGVDASELRRCGA